MFRIFGVLAFFLGFTLITSEVLAQTTTALVCNTGEGTSFGNSQDVGSGTPGGNKRIVAQKFTTGSHANGYILKKLKVEGGCAGQCRPRIRIYLDSSGLPGSHIGTSSRSFGSRAINTALAGDYALDPDTNYWAVFEDVRSASGVTQAGIYNLIVTNASGEDCATSSADWGWFIANDLRWRANSSASWQTKDKTLKIEAVGYANNVAAVGQPAISGNARTGQILTADKDDISDANGIPDNFDYQWIRVDGSNETPITGANARTYSLVRADVGKKVKVQIDFTDKSGWDESTTSNFYPTSGSIRQSPPTASDATISLLEDVIHVFSVADFNYMDADEDALQNIQITDLPDLGSLTLRGESVSVNAGISKNSIDAGQLKYIPPANAYGDNYTDFAFKVRDENGNEYSLATYVLTFDITEVNDPATGYVGLTTGDSYVGSTFQISLQNVEDVDGLTDVAYSYQWIWVLVNTKGTIIGEENIPNATNSSYTLTNQDIGKKYKVRVTFKDDLGHHEVLESPGFPINYGEVVISKPFTITLVYSDYIERQNGTVHYRFDLHSNFKFYMSKRDMRKHAFNVTNGVIKRVHRFQSDWQFIPDHYRPKPVTGHWQIEVKPIDPTQDIVIELESNRTCDERGAICSVGGESYTEGTSYTYTPNVDPLTVAIQDTTAVEDGLMLFNVEISRATKNIVRIWTRTTQEGTATEGVDFTATEHLTLFTHSRSQGLTKQIGLQVHGDSHEDNNETVIVEITRAELVRNGKTMYSLPIPNNKATGTITDVTPDEPITISVADTSARETDATIDFEVSLSKAPDKIIRVDYILQSGTAIARQDFQVPETATLCFLPSKYSSGETCRIGTTQTISIPIIDDAIDEGNETFTLLLRNASNAEIADGEATGTITNSDPLQQMWLSHFGRTVANQIVRAVTDRVTAPVAGSQIIIGGQSINLTVSPSVAIDPTIESNFSSQGKTASEVLLGSSFQLQPADSADQDRTLGAWGQVAVTDFTARDSQFEGVIELDGQVTTGLLGIDVTQEQWLTGVTLATSSGKGIFNQTGVDSGKITSSLTSINPYLRYQPNDWFQTWGLLGYGAGDLVITQAESANRAKTTTSTDIIMRLGAIGSQGVLLNSEDHNFDLALRSDAFWVRMKAIEAQNTAETTTNSSRLRLTLEGSRSFLLDEDRKLTPGIEFGLRQDGGDVETGTGIELAGSLEYVNTATGWTFTTSWYKLLVHEAANYSEWGLSSSISLASQASGAGPAFALSTTQGLPANYDPIYTSQNFTELFAEDPDLEQQLDIEFSYGFQQPLGVVTPYLKTIIGTSFKNHVGLRWKATDNLSLGLETINEEKNFLDSVMLRGSLRW